MIEQGTVLGERYILCEPLGEGGMGEVFRALDQRKGSDVAVKILRSQLADRERSRERFAREALAASHLDSERIVKIIDYNDTGDIPYIVMEFISGLPINKYARAKNLSQLELLKLVLEICDGLHHAHSRGVIHRDINPANIYVTYKGNIKILDFGLAMLKFNPELARLTHSGTALGTCSYMSPEQAKGKIADARSDLYALGATLYEVFCKRPPFPSNFSPDAILRKQVYENPIDPCTANPNLHPLIGDMIKRLMKKNPTDRYQHALELKHDVVSIINTLESKSKNKNAISINGSNSGSTNVDYQEMTENITTLAMYISFRINQWMSGGREEKKSANINPHCNVDDISALVHNISSYFNFGQKLEHWVKFECSGNNCSNNLVTQSLVLDLLSESNSKQDDDLDNYMSVSLETHVKDTEIVSLRSCGVQLEACIASRSKLAVSKILQIVKTINGYLAELSAQKIINPVYSVQSGIYTDMPAHYSLTSPAIRDKIKTHMDKAKRMLAKSKSFKRNKICICEDSLILCAQESGVTLQEVPCYSKSNVRIVSLLGKRYVFVGKTKLKNSNNYINMFLETE
ncbi:serine/threonine protein kinase [bacterium]|nr:serine/threonine protein kinase [bacterium]